MFMITYKTVIILWILTSSNNNYALRLKKLRNKYNYEMKYMLLWHRTILKEIITNQFVWHGTTETRNRLQVIDCPSYQIMTQLPRLLHIGRWPYDR